MVRFVLDMCTSIVILSCPCNELRDFVAFVHSRGMPSASDHLPQRIALVHEWFSPRSVGGAERVVQEVDSLLRNLGCEPQLAALIDAESRRLGSWLHGRSVLTSPIQHLPWGHSHVQQYLRLLLFAVEQIDLGASELVISSSHLVAKGVLAAPDQLHIS